MSPNWRFQLVVIQIITFNEVISITTISAVYPIAFTFSLISHAW
ncbi:MAG: hypothetical protein WCP08_09020 [Prolixibacteraceae bacterium]